MVLSWNEIKDRAVKFSKEWANTANEEADAKPFLVDFFNVFGISQKRVGTFEHRIKKLDEHDGYIDMIWKGTLAVEMKSRGKSLDKAYTQVKDYMHGLKSHELPKYILVSDFERFRLVDLEEIAISENSFIEFTLPDLVHFVQHFGFIAGYQKRTYKEQDPVNIKAAELMGKLHDKLKSIGYEGHPLEVYLVRLLFCLFADDTTIFNKDIFTDFIAQKTSEDGSDLAARLSELFYILNTPKEKRLRNIDEQLNEFPYVNGKLFGETLPPASFDSEMRRILLECCYLDWGNISPAIFGSMFQSVMNPMQRRNLGAHYTSEKNILKLIKPLFLDDLWAEFETVKGNKHKLTEFHKKIGALKFLDPACGCGNFLVITYRELRLLEIEILRASYLGQMTFNIDWNIQLNVDMMYGIEIEEFPARVAEVALWLIDHQMNMLISHEFGRYFTRLPLTTAPNITHGNAMQIEWETWVPKAELSYILGNPPFVGKSMQSEDQKNDMGKVFSGINGAGVLDYVTAWYLKSALYIQDTKIKVAFVATNSIVQGEQVSVLWNVLFHKYNIKIHFAHRTFRWSNEAKGNAAVHVVIIGFASYNSINKCIYEYAEIDGEPHEVKVKNINPYLIEGKDFALSSRTKPICTVPEILFGSKIVDDGNYLFTDEEKAEFLLKEPAANTFFKPILSGDEFINGKNRWVLFLEYALPNELNSMKLVYERIKKVAEFRKKSTKEITRLAALTPQRFGEPRQPAADFLLIPLTSSEKRRYIPLGFFSKDFIVTNSCSIVQNATRYHFGILTSLMHNSWVAYTCGRLKSDFRYSNTIVYNNFPWPENPSEKQIKAIETAAQNVLDARTEFPNSSLADLYDPLTMPPALVKAHQQLDKVVDLSYRPQPFTSEANRMVFLFELYEKYTANLFTIEKTKKKKKPKV